jgi:hypothetical protein
VVEGWSSDGILDFPRLIKLLGINWFRFVIIYTKISLQKYDKGAKILNIHGYFIVSFT